MKRSTNKSMTPEERLNRVEAILAATAELTRQNSEQIKMQSELVNENRVGIKALIDAQPRTMMTLDRVVNDQVALRDSIRELKDSQKKTDETLQAFIRSMERAATEIRIKSLGRPGGLPHSR